MSYQRNTAWSLARALIGGLACSLLLPATAEAQTNVTWLGGSNVSWATTGNWSNNAVPSTTNRVVYSSTSANLVGQVLGSNRSIYGITVGSISGSATISNASTITLGAGGIDMSAATGDLYAPVTGLSGNVTMNVASGRLFQMNSVFTQSSGTLTIAGSGTVESRNPNGYVTTAASSLIKVNSGATFQFTVASGNPYMALSGTLQNSGAFNSTLNPTGNAGFIINNSGVFIQDAGSSTVSSLGVNGAVTISGGTSSLTMSNLGGIAYNATSTARFTNSGGLVTFTNLVNVASGSGATASFLLSGGTTQFNVSLPTTRGVNATANVTLDGGVLRPGAANLTLLQNLTNAYVTNNGALIDTNGNTATIAQALINGTAASTNGTLTKLGSGTLALTAANTYTGATTINAGVLRIGSSGTVGSLSASSAISGSAGATLAFSRTDTITQGTDFGVIGGAINIAQAGSGLTILNEANTYTGTTSLSSGRLLLANQFAAQNSTANVTSGTIVFDSSVASNEFTIGGLAGSGTVTLANNAGTPGAIALTAGGNNENTTFSGRLTGGGSLRKTGAGGLLLTGSNDYSGATTIAGGQLHIGSTGRINSTSGVTINGGELKYNSATALTQPITFTQGTLSGTGTINTAVTVAANDIHSPGNSPGAQTVSSETWGSGGTYLWEINDWNGTAGNATNGFDQINVTNTLDVAATIGSGSTFNIQITGLTGSNTIGVVPNFNSAVGKTFTIATSGSLTNFAADKFTLDTASFSGSNSLNNGGFTIGNSGNNVVLNYIPSAVYDLAATANNATIIVGGTSTITASVTNNATGRTNPDSINFTGLTLTGLSLLPSTGSGIAANASGSGSAVFTGVSSGTVTFTPGVGSVNNATIGTSALAGGTSSVSVTVLDHALPGFVGVLDPYTTGTLTLNFGSIDESSGTQIISYSLTNLASQLSSASLTAGLDLTGFTADAGGFASGLSLFNNLQAGGTSSLFSASFTPSGQGSFSKNFTLSFSDNQSLSGASARRDLTIAMNVIVVPEPGAIALAAAGIALGAYAVHRRRRSKA